MITKAYSDSELEQLYQEEKKKEDCWTKVFRDEDSVWVEHIRACEICGKRHKLGSKAGRKCNIEIVSTIVRVLGDN